MQIVKKRFIPQLTGLDVTTDSADFEKMLDGISTSHIKEGTVVKGQVIDVTRDVVVIDIGSKNEGRVPIAEFTSDGSHVPDAGDVVEVYVEKREGSNGRTILSREKAIRERSWDQLEIACAQKKVVDGVIFGRVKGGFTVDLSGVVAFLPGSQVDVRPVKDISTLLNVKQQFQILKMDKTLGNVVVSRRAILEESRSEARAEMLSNIKEGMILEGVVKNITDYGAFVDLGEIDGLVHITDIGWDRINHPSEALTLGQKVRVMVIKFNEETKRISLGMKQLDHNPWQDIKANFPVGKQMTGKIKNIADYGVFVDLGEGREGLVHKSELSWEKSGQQSKKMLAIGQEVNFKILDVDVEKHRISLSIKRCQENPLIKFAELHPVGSIITAPIRSITDFALFVQLDGGIDGMIHAADIKSGGGDNAELLKSFHKNDMVECKVLAVDIERERVSLGIKQLSDEHHDAAEYKKNDLVKVVVTEVKSDGLGVKFDGDKEGFIKKADLSSDKDEQRSERFTVGEEVTAKVLSVGKTGKINLSIKAFEADEQKRVMEEYSTTEKGAKIGSIRDIASESKLK